VKRPAGVGWFEGYFTLTPRHLPWYAALIGAVLLGVAVFVPEVRTSFLIQLVLVEAAVLAVWILLRAGHPKIASAVAVASGWIIMAGAGLLTGGIGPVHYLTFAVVLVMAGLLLGSGGAVVVGVATIALGQFAPDLPAVAPSAPPLIRIAFAYLFIIIYLGVAQMEMRDVVRQSAASLSLLRATLESTADGILVVDNSGAVVGQNQKFLDLWRIPPELVATRDDARLIASVLGQVRDPDGFLSKIRQLYGEPDAVSFDVLEFLDGRVFERYSQPRKLDHTTVGRVWSFRDVSERRRAETARRRLEEELFQAQKMDSLGRLAGGIAHDFNNILTAIVSYTELALQDAADRPDVRESLAEVLRAANRASDLVRQILVFSRTRAEQRVPVGLPQIVGEALQLLQSTLPRRVVVVFEPIEGGPPVLADPTQIHQVVMNLGLNAGQAMREAGGTLTVRLQPTTVVPGAEPPVPGLAPGRYMALSVSDTGVGMGEETLARIFEPFFSTKAPGEGSGLGLSVVHSIVRNHEGGIAVVSARGGGSTFTVFLPVAEPEDRAAGKSSGSI
jgi:signal transduction histidine kinase